MYTSRKTLITNDNCTPIPLGWFSKYIISYKFNGGEESLDFPVRGVTAFYGDISVDFSKENPWKNCKHLTSIWTAAVLPHTGKGDQAEHCSLLTPGTLPIQCPSDQMRLGVGANTDHTYWYWLSTRRSVVHIAVRTSLNSQTPHLKMKEPRPREVAYLAQGHTDNERQSPGFHLHNVRALLAGTVLYCTCPNGCISLWLQISGYVSPLGTSQ